MKFIGNQDFIIASKAVLTVILSFLACIWFLHSAIGIYFVLYTATCCAMMQSGSNKMDHLKSMLLAGCAFLVFISLGFMLKDTFWQKNISLVFFAFLAFYLPNLGFSYKMPPIFGVIFYVCVLEMATPTDPALLIILANAIAVGIAILVYFIFWPYRPEHELTLLSCNLLDQYRKEIHLFSLALFAKNPQQRKITLHKILENENSLTTSLNSFNELSGHTSLEKEDKAYFNELYIHFYGTFQMTKMMCGTMGDFPANPDCAILLKDLSLTLHEIETQFNARLPHSLLSKFIPIVHSSSKKPLSLAEFDSILAQLVTENMVDTPAGQFAYGLLRLKEAYTDMKTRLDHWQLRRPRGLFL